jgi:hypothetical protein
VSLNLVSPVPRSEVRLLLFDITHIVSFGFFVCVLQQYMLTAEKVSAQQLLAEGQLLSVTDDIDAEVKKVSSMILENAPTSLSMVKEACLYVAHHNDE